jgi:hypothetical protein
MANTVQSIMWTQRAASRRFSSAIAVGRCCDSHGTDVMRSIRPHDTLDSDSVRLVDQYRAAGASIDHP